VILGVIGLIMLLGTGTLLLLVRDWRISIGLLALQYLAMFLVVLMMWPFSVALIKLMVGWMVAAGRNHSCRWGEFFVSQWPR
jgi:hypothetical protein